MKHWLLLFFWGLSAQTTDVTTLTLPRLDLEAGTSLVYEVDIDCVVDGCSAFDIILSYDPRLIQVDELEVGPYLGEQILVVESSIDPEGGTLHLAAARVGDLPETEETSLLFIHLTALESGQTSFIVERVDIGDLQGNPLEVALTSGETSEATPEVLECRVSAENNLVQVRVGPGVNRTSVAYLPSGVEFVVQGQVEDAVGTIWYLLDKEEAAPNKLISEAWVSSVDVTASDGCVSVVEVSAPPIIPIARATQPAATTNGGGSAVSGIQQMDATVTGCQTIELYNPNPFEMGVGWSASNGQSDYYRASGGSTTRIRLASDAHSTETEYSVEILITTATGDWVHTINLTVDACKP